MTPYPTFAQTDCQVSPIAHVLLQALPWPKEPQQSNRDIIKCIFNFLGGVLITTFSKHRVWKGELLVCEILVQIAAAGNVNSSN